MAQKQLNKEELMQLRRQSRELALQILFQGEFEKDLSSDQGFELYRGSFDSTPEVWDFAKGLVHGVLEKKENIDAKIQAHSSHWKIDRMAHVDRNVLRVAVYEMFFSDKGMPKNAVINEAIEVAKKFGSTESGAFINGILDQISKSG